MDDHLPLSSGQTWLLGVYRRRGATWMIVVTTAVSVLLSVTMTATGFLVRHSPVEDWISGMIVSATIPLVVAPLGSSQALRLLGAVADAYDRLSVVANTDALTGLANRRRFFNEAERLAGLLDGDQALLVAMIDLNYFKEVNDSRGHAVGDAALVALARQVVAAAGPDSMVGRLGGDEFACLAPESSHGVEAFRRTLTAACSAVPVDENLLVSASVGVARLTVGMDLDAAMVEADTDLYRAKESRERPVQARTAPRTPEPRA